MHEQISFSIGVFTVPLFGLIQAAGLVVATLVLIIRSRTAAIEWHSPVAMYIVLIWIGLAGGAFGARLLYPSLAGTASIMEGNSILASHVTVVAVLALLWPLLKLKHLRYLDLVVCSLALQQAIGKVGCSLAGCCYGSECTLPWAVRRSSGISVHPVQLYEAGALLFLACYLWHIGTTRFGAGTVAGAYLMLYGFIRAGAEMMRGDAEISVGAILLNQWIAGAICGIGALLIITSRNRGIQYGVLQKSA